MSMDTKTSIYGYAKTDLNKKLNKTAIWFYGKSIRYKELFDRIDNVADNLCSIGVKFGDVITVHTPNCPEAIITIYALAKIGAISNIVHPLTPLKALKENMEKTRSRILITSNIFKDAEKIDFTENVYCIRLSRSMGFISGGYLELQSCFYMPKGVRKFTELEKKCNNVFLYPNEKSLFDKCACYMHSSGSTGKPKIVMHSHKNINNWVENYRSYRKKCGFSNNPISLSFLPLFHGAGFAAGMHVQISSGWKLILISKINFKQMLRFIKRKRVTDIIAVPSMYTGFLKQKNFNKHTTKHVENYYVGADTMLPEIKKQVLDRSAKSVNGIFELYGMSETVLGCFMTEPQHNNLYAAGYKNSYPECDIAVINENGFFYKNAEGEFVVNTNTMFMGYLDDREASDNCIINHDGKSWIRSGDWGEIDADGYVYFKYRIKNIIIRKGMNIFPQEVEECIRKLDFIKDVCVVGPVNKETGSQYVRACVILKDNILTDESIKGKIKKQVSDNMLKHCTPEEIIFMKKFPSLTIGKIDRAKLSRGSDSL